MLQLLYLPVLTLLILLYFRLALQFKIIDKPNQRSSHSRLTIRGGGVIFPIAIILHSIFSGFQYSIFTSGLILISFVSFYDDLQPLANKIRLLGHLIAVSLLFIQTGLLTYPVWIVISAYILVVGTINAYNFMDGINGITGSYSLITIVSLYFINESYIEFVVSEWLIVVAISLVVFNFFNFRKKAKCFAGDVGSISMAFILIFFILLLILKSGEIKFIILLLIYGVDSVTTIILRLFRRENIFEAHRTHFYQYLANVRAWPHLSVSILYSLLQLTINFFIYNTNLDISQLCASLVFIGLAVILIRIYLEGRDIIKPDFR